MLAFLGTIDMNIIKSVMFGNRIYGPGDEQDLIDANMEAADAKKETVDWARLEAKNIIDQAPGRPPKGGAKAPVLNQEKSLDRMSKVELIEVAKGLELAVSEEDTKATLIASITAAREGLADSPEGE